MYACTQAYLISSVRDVNFFQIQENASTLSLMPYECQIYTPKKHC